MSLGVNLSSKDLAAAYGKVLSGDPEVEWAVFSYDKGTNDLKVQESGNGGLEEMIEEFMDSRYASDPRTLGIGR